MELIETEVKFHFDNLEPIRNQAVQKGAEAIKSEFETNTLYDDPKRTLAGQKSVLRLRKTANILLTLKQKKDTAIDPGDCDFKINREYEVTVNDHSKMEYILNALGFHRQIIYEKERETFTCDGMILCFDKMPYGNFLEIEGSKTGIKNLASKIGLDWKNRITANYLELFNLVKIKYNLSFQDITFKNFKGLKIDLFDIIGDLTQKNS